MLLIEKRKFIEKQRVLDAKKCWTKLCFSLKQLTQANNHEAYVGNRNTKKFHYAECSSVSDMKDNNKVFFDNRNDAVSKGFTPCKRCNP